MKRLLVCFVLLGLLTSATGAAEKTVQPTDILKKSYSKTVSAELLPEQPYSIVLETNKSYYLLLKDSHDYIAKLPKAAVAEITVELGKATLFFNEPFLFEDDRAYLIFFQDQEYRVTASTDAGYRVRYELGDTKLEVGVSRKEFIRPDLVLEEPKDAICMIQYENGGGSGFLLEMEDGLYCITNQHVIANTGIPEIRLISGKQLQTGDYEFALDRDMARIRILDEAPAFTSLGEPDLDDKITVLGNSYARGRVTLLSGRVTGLNEMEIETTAKFVPGNSGSPILSEKNHVLGVATAIEFFVKNNSFAEGTIFEGGRRVGLRIDDSIEWVPVDMNLFASRNRNLLQIDRFVDELPRAYTAFARTSADQTILVSDFTDRSLKNWVSFRNTRFAYCVKAFEQAKEAGYAEAPDRYDYTAQGRLDREAYEASIQKEVTACWTAMRQKLQSKQRSLRTYTPYPDTTYMRDHIEGLESVIDTALEVTMRIQKGLAEAQ